MKCKAELCEFWTGSGCICEVMGGVLDIEDDPPEPVDDACDCCDLCDYCFCHWT